MEGAASADWRLHDLRRTCATGMQELGISNDVVQSVLNHAIGGVGGVYLGRRWSGEGRGAGDMGWRNWPACRQAARRMSWPKRLPEEAYAAAIDEAEAIPPVHTKGRVHDLDHEQVSFLADNAV